MIEAAMFWNEPNNKSHWDPELDPDWSIFADTVTRAGRAVVAINPAVIGMGGRLVVAGYHQDGPRQVNMQDWNWKGIDVVNAHERDPAVHRHGLREAVAAVAGGRAGGSIWDGCSPMSIRSTGWARRSPPHATSRRDSSRRW